MKFFTKKILKEENYKKGLELLKELRDKSRLEEGCIYYDLYQDADEKYTIIINEEWESEEAQINHTKTEHFKRIVPAVADLCEKPFKLVRFVDLKD